MPKTTESLNSELFDLLKSRGMNPITLDSSGKETPIPDEADIFQFHFHSGDRDYGTVTLTIDGLKNLILYYNDSVMKSGGELDDWIKFLKNLKRFAYRRQLGFELKNVDRLGSDMKRRTYTKKLEESVGWLENALLNEASLDTMRKYFAGDADAKDSLKITQQRLYFDKDKKDFPTKTQHFRSHDEYQKALKQNKLSAPTSMTREDEVAEASYPGNIGMMELAKFFQIASPADKEKFNQLKNLNKKELAWQLVQDVVGVKLQGKEFQMAEGSEDKKFIVTYQDVTGMYTVLVSADDEYDARDKINYILGRGARVTDTPVLARGNEVTDQVYKTFRDPRGGPARSQLVNVRESQKDVTESKSKRWDGRGFSVRSTQLWPAIMFESASSATGEFNEWLNQQRDSQKIPAKNSPCILAMIVRAADKISVFYGKAEYLGQTDSEYQLKIDSGAHQYSKSANQVVFDSQSSFEKFMMLLKLKYEGGDVEIQSEKMPVMETEKMSEDKKPGLWANIHAKRERIKSGSGERMRKPGSKGAPTAQNFKDAASEGVAEGSLDDIEDTKQFKAAIALAKSQKAIRQAKDGKDAKYYADGTKVTPAEVARRAAERKAKKQSVAEGLVGDVVVHNYTKMPIDLEPGQAQIAGWGPNDEPLYRVKGQDGKEVKTWSKRRMLTIAKEQGVAEGSMNQYKSAVQAIQKLQSFAHENPDFNLSQLDNLPSRGNPIKPMFDNANSAIDTLIQTYLTRKEPGNAEFLKQLKNEIKYFLTDRTISSDPVTLGELLQGKLGKINFQQSMTEGSVEPKHKEVINKEKTKVPKAPKDEYERKVEKYLKQKYSKGNIEEDFNGEYDDEAGMAQTNLHTIARAAQGLMNTIDSNDNLPEWVQEKIAKVEGMMVTAWDYLKSQEEQGIDPKMAQSSDNNEMANSLKTELAGIYEGLIAKKQTKSTVASQLQAIAEGYYGTKNTSYSDNVPTTIKMIIKHNRPIGEGDQRFRHIARIFLESETGARWPVPTVKPSVARVFARHLAEGGDYNDERWNHITQISEDVDSLSGFVRATKNKQFNESATRVVGEVTEQWSNLKKTIKQLSGTRGYHNYFESWTPQLMESDCDASSLMGHFTNSSIDPRIERALPVLARMNISVTEISEAEDFKNWADSILDEALAKQDSVVSETDQPDLRGQRDKLLSLLGGESEPMPVGPDAINAIGLLSDVIEDPVLNRRLARIASVNPDQDARDTVIAWMREQSNNTVYDEVIDEIEQETPGVVAKEKPETTAPTKKAEKQEEPDNPPSTDDNQTPPPPVTEDEISFFKKLLSR
jgi:hypothetical protein